jgi:hypothetical protein
MRKCTKIESESKDRKIHKNMLSKKKVKCIQKMERYANATREDLNLD